MRRSILPLAALCVAALAPGCGETAIDGPPELRLGLDECVECGMSIIEDRSSCALIAEAEGERRYFIFDDLGCMLDYEREHVPALVVHRRYARDYQSREWIDAESAIYLNSPDGISTPMASGFAALGSRESAETLRATAGGEALDYPALVSARLLWKQERRAAQERARQQSAQP